MGNGIMKLIVSFVTICLIAIFVIFGYIFVNEFGFFSDKFVQPTSFQTELSDQNTVDKDIKTPQIINDPLSSGLDSNQISNMTYDNVSVDKYFYNQLDNNSKIIYKAFESNKETMKSGTKKIEFGTTFSDILGSANGSDILSGYYQSAIEAYTYDNPEVFYLSPNKMYLNVETITRGNSTTYNVYVDSGNEANYFIDEFQNEAQVNSAIEQLRNVKSSIVSKKTGNPYNDIKMVHDYLVDTIEYDSSISQSNIYNIYGALINKLCVCEGYARSMKYILDDLNIPSVMVIGKGTNSAGNTENHAWNYIQLNGNWYAVDSTWDDPIIYNGGTLTNNLKYKYFLKGSSDFSKDHEPNGQFTEGGKVFNYPTISQQNFN